MDNHKFHCEALAKEIKALRIEIQISNAKHEQDMEYVLQELDKLKGKKNDDSR